MFKKDVDLKPYNTFGISAQAQNFVSYDTLNELQDALPLIQTFANNRFILGGGSNVLFCSDYNGLIIHPQTKGFEIISDNDLVALVRVQAGEVWDDFVAWTVEKKLCGAENLSAIPGSVGASVVQNIGAYGVEAKDLVAEVEVMDLQNGTIKRLFHSDCEFAYRNSVFKSTKGENLLVISVVFQLQKKMTPLLSYAGMQTEVDLLGGATLENIRQAVFNLRNSKLPNPAVIGNAGSFFKNPIIPQYQADAIVAKFQEVPLYPASEGYKKIAAAWLIEKAGWKGHRRQTVGVHDKQALVLINIGNAKGADVKQLAADICKSVYELFAISISPEVIFVE